MGELELGKNTALLALLKFYEIQHLLESDNLIPAQLSAYRHHVGNFTSKSFCYYNTGKQIILKMHF